MAKQNKISMPNSGAGLTSFLDGDDSNIVISPKAAVITIAILTVIIAIAQGAF